MARAFLKLADEVRDAFVAAQAPESTVRVIAVDIADEDTLVVAFTEEETGKGEQEDFNTLLQLRVSADKPLVLLFRLDEDSTSGAGGAKKWLFITWVPDASKVRQKMLFSSSKIDLKEGLGLNYFRGEYHASEKSELSYAAYNKSIDTSHDGDLLTERERIQKGMRLLDNAGHGIKSNAMGVIPFSATDETSAALKAFADKKLNFVEMGMGSGESIILKSSKIVSMTGLRACIDATMPTFILACDNSGPVFFIYSCPESAPVQQKMMCATARATVAGIVEEACIQIEKSVEIGDPDEIDEAMAYELRNGKPADGTPTKSASATKPSRPGRGRSRLTQGRGLATQKC